MSKKNFTQLFAMLFAVVILATNTVPASAYFKPTDNMALTAAFTGYAIYTGEEPIFPNPGNKLIITLLDADLTEAQAGS